jgi:hypothetical protein
VTWQKRRYKIYATQLPSRKQALQMAEAFRNDGFRLLNYIQKTVSQKPATTGQLQSKDSAFHSSTPIQRKD